MKYLIILMLALGACTSTETSVEVLEKQGFTNIQTTGYDFFACSEEDTFHTGFTATNTRGQTVSGVVCCGWLKRCTVRF